MNLVCEKQRVTGTRPVRMFALSLMLCMSIGCGKEAWKSATYPAGGSFTVNGKPAVGAVVELVSLGQPPDERNSRPWAIVKEDGSYTLSTYESEDGAPVGNYAITLRWPPDVTQPSFEDQLGGKYTTARATQWSVEIKEGENSIDPIVIEGVKLGVKSSGKRATKSPPGPPMVSAQQSRSGR
ncbi:hypothetical protein LOC67_03090 [Stieleria sp. JC731]|uniref:hypothetical protein n=1 Tax=Pirellulaceae TaxID=2691357 RepID=UPI001E320CF6|nr:hypothetical protein [Stieleria sp. JC731]MCC9599532.1 hypothetical protein [Stieleria sp. JC731]